jgi:hypothetical protein
MVTALALRGRLRGNVSWVTEVRTGRWDGANGLLVAREFTFGVGIRHDL